MSFAADIFTKNQKQLLICCSLTKKIAHAVGGWVVAGYIVEISSKVAQVFFKKAERKGRVVTNMMRDIVCVRRCFVVCGWRCLTFDTNWFCMLPNLRV